MKNAAKKIYISEIACNQICSQIMSEYIEPTVPLYGRYKLNLWVGITVGLLQPLSGFVMSVFYAPQVFQKQGETLAQFLSLIVIMINFFGGFVSMLASDSKNSICLSNRTWEKVFICRRLIRYARRFINVLYH